MCRRARSCLLVVAGILPGMGFCPVYADSILNFPRLSFEPNTSIGTAFVNPSDQDALVIVTAYNSDGNLSSAGGFQNPAQIIVPARRQVSKLT